MKRLIFHVDVNSAFLSWEAVRRIKEGLPDLREIPSCIGGDPQKRTGIVVAKSIPAKKYGIQTGEPMAMALCKCPGLVTVPSDFELYDKYSRAFKAICASYAPVMESFSIDEVFLDMTGTSLIYPDPVAAAHELEDKIHRELGFTVNVGISTNKLLAKMASDFQKPDRVHTLFPDEIPEKMWPLPIRNLLFLGKASEQKLLNQGIRTIGDLARERASNVQYWLGEKTGHQLWQYARGIDDSPVKAVPDEAKGFSVETTFNDDITSIEQVFPILLEQCDVLATRMRRKDKKCNCISVTFRTLDFRNRSHQTKLENAKDLTDGNTLKVLVVDKKTGVKKLVNAKSYKVDENGTISVNLPKGCDYLLVNTKEAEKVEKAVLKTVQAKKTSASVKKGKSTKIQLSSKLDMDNVKSVTYTTTKKSVVKVAKNGKITAKKKGTAVVKATVTLKSGKKKTVTMKVKVK